MLCQDKHKVEPGVRNFRIPEKTGKPGPHGADVRAGDLVIVVLREAGFVGQRHGDRRICGLSDSLTCAVDLRTARNDAESLGWYSYM